MLPLLWLHLLSPLSEIFFTTSPWIVFSRKLPCPFVKVTGRFFLNEMAPNHWVLQPKLEVARGASPFRYAQKSEIEKSKTRPSIFLPHAKTSTLRDLTDELPSFINCPFPPLIHANCTLEQPSPTCPFHNFSQGLPLLWSPCLKFPY